jgi:hypothetical protein
MVLNRPKMQKKKPSGINSRQFKTVQYIMSLNKFLDGLSKIVRNSRLFSPNRLKTVLDDLAKTDQPFFFFFFFFFFSVSIIFYINYFFDIKTN